MLLALLLQAAPPAGPAGIPGGPAGRGQPPATILAEPAALMLAGCDRDGDARVTLAEARACVARAFATADGAAGGGIGYIAYADWCQRWLGDRNALPGPYEVDADGDNRITAAELGARFDRFFGRYDVNHDGVLVRAELITIRAAAPGQENGRRGRRGRDQQTS